MSETPLTDTPLYAATLSDALSSARDRVDRAQQRAAEAERRAADVVAKVQAQLAQAELNITYATIKAPQDEPSAEPVRPAMT